MFGDRYRVILARGSIIPYEIKESNDIFKSVRRAKKHFKWNEELLHELRVDVKELEIIDWIKPYIEKSVDAIYYKKGAYIEALLIVKIKQK